MRDCLRTAVDADKVSWCDYHRSEHPTDFRTVQVRSRWFLEPRSFLNSEYRCDIVLMKFWSCKTVEHIDYCMINIYYIMHKISSVGFPSGQLYYILIINYSTVLCWPLMQLGLLSFPTLSSNEFRNNHLHHYDVQWSAHDWPRLRRFPTLHWKLMPLWEAIRNPNPKCEGMFGGPRKWEVCQCNALAPKILWSLWTAQCGSYSPEK